MIQLRSISKAFHKSYAVRNVDLDVESGEAVAVVGESGAGKSTLGRILLRLMDPTSGSYTFDGVDVLAKSASELRAWRRQVQAVFQNPVASLNPRLQICRLVTEPYEVADRLTARERLLMAEELLGVVGLRSDLARRYPHQLSGGQCQRVVIARAISTKPRFIVLDEPVSSLDVSLKAQILNLLKDIRERQGVAYIYITHDLGSVPFLADRVHFMNNGEVVEMASTLGMHQRVQHPYSRALLASVLTLEPRDGSGSETSIGVGRHG
jgi:ABC-type glutathione transport system ATPase component